MKQSPLTSFLRVASIGLAVCVCVLASNLAEAQLLMLKSFTATGEGQEGTGVLATDEAVQNALTDFARHAERNDWQKAFRVLENLPAEKRVGMLPAGNGFMVPAPVRFWQLMVEVNAEGRSAFRLFNEPKAKQLYDKLQKQLAANDPQAKITARQIYDLYFITSYGDDVANLLGDLAFEKGDFAEAASLWRSVVDFHADSDIPLPRLLTKSATAYVASGRVTEARSLLDQLKQRYASETVKIAGKERLAVEYVTELLSHKSAGSSTARTELDLQFPEGTLKPLWQVPFLSNKGGEALRQAMANNGYSQSGVGTMVPQSQTDGQRIYLNWVGIIFAIDVPTGKLAWRSDSFEKLHPHLPILQQGRVNFSDYGIQLIGDRLLTTALPLDRLQHWQPAMPLSSWSSKTGEKQWSIGGEQNGNTSYLGQFYPWKDGVLVVSHVQQQPAMSLSKLNLSSGATEWTMPLGSFQQRSNPYTGGVSFLSPEFAEIGNQLCVMNNSGAVLQLSLAEKKVDGQFMLYEPKPTTNGANYYYGNEAILEEKRLHTRGRMLVRDGLVLLKEVGQSEMFCVDMQSKKVLWKRPTVSSAMIVDADDELVYLMNTELAAYDRNSGKLQWSVMLPISGGGLGLLSSGESVFAATRRGIFELRRTDGRVIRIIRLAETDSFGISMQVIGDTLVTISNSAVTGYRLGAAPVSAKSEPATE